MENKNSLPEELLDSWLNISMKLWNERCVSHLSYNESLVCHLLNSKRLADPAHPHLTLMQLSKETGILKSQMNKTITSLEERGMITRVRSTEDKRIVYITLLDNKENDFYIQHEEILRIVNHVIGDIGTEKAAAAIDIFNSIAESMTGYMEENDL